MGCIYFLKAQKFPAESQRCLPKRATQKGDPVTGMGLRIKAKGLIFNLVAVTSLHLNCI
jgi:hypothetical protein